MREIRAYADARGVKPSTVLQLGAGLSGMAWSRWESGAATCSLRTVERLRGFMRDNPPNQNGAAR